MTRLIYVNRLESIDTRLQIRRKAVVSGRHVNELRITTRVWQFHRMQDRRFRRHSIVGMVRVVALARDVPSR